MDEQVPGFTSQTGACSKHVTVYFQVRLSLSVRERPVGTWQTDGQQRALSGSIGGKRDLLAADGARPVTTGKLTARP